MYGTDNKILCRGVEEEVKLSEKEREKRIDLLCESYSLIKDLVTIFGVPAEHREDLIQDILLLAYRHIDDLKETEKMNSWLYKIAYRRTILFSKERKLLLEQEVYGDEDIIEDIPDCSSREAWELCDSFFENDELADMVMSLKKPAPLIIRLRFVNGYTLKEIADILKMNYSTVRVMEYRALKKLKAMIIERGSERNADVDQEA